MYFVVVMEAVEYSILAIVIYLTALTRRLWSVLLESCWLFELEFMPLEMHQADKPVCKSSVHQRAILWVKKSITRVKGH